MGFMPKLLTASDRSVLLKLVASLPQGDETRRAVLAGLRQTAAPKNEAEHSVQQDARSLW